MLKSGNYPDAIIEMQNVGIRYGQGAEVLSDIKLSLKRGSFHFLTGRKRRRQNFAAEHDVSGSETEPGNRQRLRQER